MSHSNTATHIVIDTPNDVYTQTPSPIHSTHDTRALSTDIALEFLGTALFVYISLAGVSQSVLYGTGDQVHIAICFALGLASGIIVAGKSGGHLNPAVSLVVYLTDSKFKKNRLVGYMIAQVLGGVAAGLMVLATYYSKINNVSNTNIYIGMFGTLKQEGNSLVSAIFDQFVGSALLMVGIVMTPDSWSKPLTVGAVLGGLGLFQGSNGFAFNLARDFGPRLASSIVFGGDAFSAEDYWMWVPAIVPFFGIAFGCFVAMAVKQMQ